MKPMYRWWCWCLLVGLCGLSRWAEAQPVAESAVPADLFRDGDTIVFFGDSITQGGLYIDHIEAWLLTRFPDKKFQVFNRGISSETISGTSETDHDPRRPWAHERFTRDIVPLQPDVVIACFGMNDGNYHPFDWPRFEKYQQGVRRLIERVRDEAGARTLILMTPPPYDPYQRKAGDPAAKEFGYKFAAINYDETLGRYAQWLMSLRGEGQIVVDLHGALNRHVRQRRETQVSFSIAPDSVHPNMTGHWLMALQFVRQVPLAPAPGMTALNPALENGVWASDVTLSAGAPIDPQVDQASIDLESLRAGEFSGPVLACSQIDPVNRYAVSLDGVKLGEFDGISLHRGLAIPNDSALKVVQQRQELLKKVRERRTLEYWQFRAGTDKPLGNKPPVDDIPARLVELSAEIELLRQPVTSRIEIHVLN